MPGSQYASYRIVVREDLNSQNMYDLCAFVEQRAVCDPTRAQNVRPQRHTVETGRKGHLGVQNVATLMAGRFWPQNSS